jgi:hypothetical protein
MNIAVSCWYGRVRRLECHIALLLGRSKCQSGELISNGRPMRSLIAYIDDVRLNSVFRRFISKRHPAYSKSVGGGFGRTR